MSKWPVRETIPRLYMSPKQVAEAKRKMAILKEEYVKSKAEQKKKQ